MKVTHTAALASFVFSAGVLADECSKNCKDAFEKCEAVPGTDLSTCSNNYAKCLGYDPYATSPYVEPTACGKGPTKPTGGPAPDACAKNCNDTFDKCEAAPGADLVTCSNNYAKCLGYDPYATSPFVKPTACGKGPTKPTGVAVPDECCKKCTADHEACKAGPHADKAACEKKYSDCLGYNPFQGTFVQPTTCVRGPKPGGNGEVPVVVAGGNNLKPAMAVLALAAVALF